MKEKEDRIVIDEEHPQRQWRVPPPPWEEELPIPEARESVAEMLGKIDYLPKAKDLKEVDIPGRLEEKYWKHPVIREWLITFWPSMACFEAFIMPIESFLSLLLLRHGEKVEEALARDLLKEEAQNSGRSSETMQELKKRYRKWIPELKLSEVRQYSRSKRRIKRLDDDEKGRLMIRLSNALCALLAMEYLKFFSTK